MERLSRSEPPMVTQEERGERQFAALSYLWIFSLFILVAKRGNPFIQHHARRGSVLFLLSIVFWFISYLWYAEFLILALAIFGFIQAATGNENDTPVLAEIADGSLKKRDLKSYWSKAKAKVTGKPEESVSSLNETPIPHTETQAETDTEKVSALFHRLTEDENELHRLEHKVEDLEVKLTDGGAKH